MVWGFLNFGYGVVIWNQFGVGEAFLIDLGFGGQQKVNK